MVLKVNGQLSIKILGGFRMKMKALLIALIFGGAIALAGVATAQDSGRPMLTRQQMIEKRLAHMKKALQLTDAQSAQLRSIWEQNAEKMKSDLATVRNSAKGTPARKDAVAQMKADGQSLRHQMAAVLTPEQRREFKRMRLQMIRRRIQRLKRHEQRLEN